MTAPQAKGASWRSLLALAGIALVLLSLVFVALRLRDQIASLRQLANGYGLLLLVGGGFVYGASLLLISHAFWLLLRWQGELGVASMESHRIYGRAQIAKYLPGNVVQFVARHVAYRERGVSDGALGLAALYEALGMAGAASCLALLGFPFLNLPIIAGGGARLILALGVGLGAAVCGIGVLPRLLAWVARRRGQATRERLTARNVARLLLLYGAFFLVSGTLALYLHRHASTQAGFLLEIIPAYALAWLCGFVVPGASAGIGVREAVIVLLFGENPASLFMAMGMRVITTLGDALLLAATTIWPRAQHDAEERNSK
jgi:hypothetical protein